MQKNQQSVWLFACMQCALFMPAFILINPPVSPLVRVELLGYSLFLMEVNGGLFPCTVVQLRQAVFCFFSFIVVKPFSTYET